MIPAGTETSVARPGSVATWSGYDVAPGAAFQTRVGVFETPVDPLTGEESVGAAGGLPAPVVKLNVADQPLVPPAFAAPAPVSAPDTYCAIPSRPVRV